MRRALVFGSDVKAMPNLVGVIGEYLHEQAVGVTMFDDVEPSTLQGITTIVIFDRHGNPFVYTVTDLEDDVDLEADTALEEPPGAESPHVTPSQDGAAKKRSQLPVTQNPASGTDAAAGHEKSRGGRRWRQKQ